MRKWMTPVMYTLIGLAVFFVAVQLFTNTSSFLNSILMMVGFAVLIYGAIYFLFLRNRGFGGGGNRNEMKKYKQAVKQSKQKYKQPAPVVKKKTVVKAQSKPSPLGKRGRKRSSGPQLRVIEGNKSKDKNRATF
ncbi:SA1362 family protein [Halobacillus sp. ACCC02827]|uniref:SA1362 family protein n=1 Tax=unclassified Halobacillus TaxID=2636472 RepID=UPI000781E3AB|nr:MULTISPECIES: SA1362 family protein [unclassified Halobacillus]WJE14363.1 SA1362 family protein [Halobacillus sp. ACCC02827]